MTMPIDPIALAAPATSSALPAATGSGAASGFGTALNNLLTSVDSTNNTANQAVANMLDGHGDVHDAMIALQNADMTLQLTVQIRNKIVQAYQDVMRMPA